MGMIHLNAPAAPLGSSRGMNDELSLRRTAERYRRLLRMVIDPRAVASLQHLLAETEARLEALEEQRAGLRMPSSGATANTPQTTAKPRAR